MRKAGFVFVVLLLAVLGSAMAQEIPKLPPEDNPHAKALAGAHGNVLADVGHQLLQVALADCVRVERARHHLHPAVVHENPSIEGKVCVTGNGKAVNVLRAREVLDGHHLLR